MAESSCTSDEPRSRAIYTQYTDIQPYVTKDNSVIRELMHPNVHSNTHVSVAEATTGPGETSLLHRHVRSEEIYHITSGSGIIEAAGKQYRVAVKDTICFKPGVEHRIINDGETPLTILCISSPPYQHEDTVLVSTAN